MGDGAATNYGNETAGLIEQLQEPGRQALILFSKPGGVYGFGQAQMGVAMFTSTTGKRPSRP
ncbi:MAG: hypothetical protein C0483_21095 [Pirellula sp.]|nr:hypothetical protein [Pirellula sp.]